MNQFVTKLYDQKKSCAFSHHNINKLQVKLATSRDASLVRLPPSEAALQIDTSFHQPLPNMVQRLCADVINDAIWFMNIHEQNHP
jgi:hypothetical protein